MALGKIKGVSSWTIGALMTNPLFLIIFAIGLIVFVLFGIGICLLATHWIVAFALFLLAVVVIGTGTIQNPKIKIPLFLLLLAMAVLVFIRPDFFGMG